MVSMPVFFLFLYCFCTSALVSLEFHFHAKKSPRIHKRPPKKVTVSRVENPLKQQRDHYETNELLLWSGTL